MTARDTAVVIVAAGRGERLGADQPKAFVKIDGKTLIEHSLNQIATFARLEQVIIAVPSGFELETQRLADSALSAHQHPRGIRLDVVLGGATRQGSIANALKALDQDVEIVLVHDAARAFQPLEVFDRVAHAVRATGQGVIPVEPVTDTIKVVSGDLVLETIDRSTLRKAQTPQGFPARQLAAAYDRANADFTDDAALWQANGGSVSHVQGDSAGRKITFAHDLESLVGEQFYTGIGTDTHRFTDDADKKLFLGTVEWPGERGLDGHSDGDAVSHAIVDALLSAAGLGDIGSNFGVDRPEFAGANGRVFLEATRELLTKKGFSIGNVSVQIIGNRPKVAPHRERTERALSQVLGCPVSLGATTTDGLGFLGNSEGVAAVASALLKSAKGRLGA
jgi:2-C-methyl-D-erythritol 4-phosphate cytidylyltransferase/2-C-methyl-D-erythritol 2,4-cyclodiphosphate synthase